MLQLHKTVYTTCLEPLACLQGCLLLWPHLFWQCCWRNSGLKYQSHSRKPSAGLDAPRWAQPRTLYCCFLLLPNKCLDLSDLCVAPCKLICTYSSAERATVDVLHACILPAAVSPIHPCNCRSMCAYMLLAKQHSYRAPASQGLRMQA